jgi:hypothetical protein
MESEDVTNRMAFVSENLLSSTVIDVIDVMSATK